MAAIHSAHGLHPPSGLTVSARSFTIAGILVVVYGLAELSPSATSVACLWLLHPRLKHKEAMAPLANQIITAWNRRVQHDHAGTEPMGLIAVSFDGRNHGSRLVNELHNKAWRDGNPRHAQDMFSCLQGTAADTSQLISHLESYIFTAANDPRICRHLCLGISLGGHVAWHCLLSDPRVRAAVVGIGCPDYTRLMIHRACRSKLPTYVASDPPGAVFHGSPDFPRALQDAIAQYDPAGLLLPIQLSPDGPISQVDEATMQRFKTLLKERLQGKQILSLSGRVDKLVPYAASEPFLTAFKRALAEEPELDIRLEDVLFDGVGHAFSEAMADKATEWLCDILANDVVNSVSSRI